MRRKGNEETCREKNSFHVWLCGVLTSWGLGVLELNPIAVTVWLVKKHKEAVFQYLRWRECCVMTNGLVKYPTLSISSCLKSNQSAFLF